MQFPEDTSQSVRAQMEHHLKGADWSLRQKLAIAARILAHEEHTPGLAGQISARDENEPRTSWTLRFGDGFDEVTARGLVRVDDDLTVLDGDGMANPATRFHMWIYRNRPGVNAIVHTHPMYISALSTLGEPLMAAHMDTMPLYGECAFLSEWPGVPIADEEGRIISEALGDKRAILLAHHGMLTACESIEEATYLAFWIEHAARMQILASSVGAMKAVNPELAGDAHDFLMLRSVVRATFAYWGRKTVAREPDCLD
ncbi:aldolase [Arhodomonas sp. SL1]|uniref:aldolase n=1 Tax=Arhodomonas sp. SL1 TaxID=3425691 RepID=UPI003F882090